MARSPVRPTGAPDTAADTRVRAGFWIRFLGSILDALFVAAVLGVIGLVFDPPALSASFLLGTAVSLVYHTLFIGSESGSTLGMKVVRIKAVNLATGGRVAYWRALVRDLVSYVSGYAFLLGFLWMLWDEESQTWHDHAAGTIVVPTSKWDAIQTRATALTDLDAGPHLRPVGETLLRVEHMVVEFPVGKSGLKVHAVSDVSIDIKEGETLGLVGESGCGKSTLARAAIQLPPPTSGRVLFEGNDLTRLTGEELRRVRPRMQMIFQDPISSLNPRRKIGDLVGEGLQIWGIGNKQSRAQKVDEVLDAVGIDPDAARGRRPHEFSGGQCQRISIARAIVTEPKLIICDEPVSALDVSVQAQIINLLQDMKDRYGLTLIFIAHDLAVVKNVSDRVAVMYLGKLCEFGPPDEIYETPVHPYTAALLKAIPVPDPNIRPEDREALKGEIPSPIAPPSGCRFRTRCPKAEQKCAEEEPAVREIRPGRFAACHFPLEPGEELDFTRGEAAQAEAEVTSSV